MAQIIRGTLQKLYYLKSFLLFKSCGKNILLSRGGTFVRPREVTLGSNIYIGRNFHISARSLRFGNNIMIGPNLVIECDNHIYSNPGYAMFEMRNQREIGFVSIEDDVWIGANVTILPNSIISEGCVIGAGSVITKSLPPYSICVGTPCMPIKPRFSLPELQDHLIKVKSVYGYEKIREMWINCRIIE